MKYLLIPILMLLSSCFFSPIEEHRVFNSSNSDGNYQGILNDSNHYLFSAPSISYWKIGIKKAPEDSIIISIAKKYNKWEPRAEEFFYPKNAIITDSTVIIFELNGMFDQYYYKIQVIK